MINPKDIIRKKHLKKMIKELEGRIKLLEEYRNKDINKEILDCLNLKNKYDKMLKKMKDSD